METNKNNQINLEPIKKRLPIMSLILREKKFLINPDFQLQFMASLLLISIISMSIIYIANDYFFNSYMLKGEALNLPPDHPFFLMIHEQKKFMTQVFIMVAVSISCIAAVWGLFYSHKIAGPLHRLEKYFKDAAINGEKINKKIYFRDEDFFQEVPESINKYIESLKPLADHNKTKENDETDIDHAA